MGCDSDRSSVTVSVTITHTHCFSAENKGNLFSLDQCSLYSLKQFSCFFFLMRLYGKNVDNARQAAWMYGVSLTSKNAVLLILFMAYLEVQCESRATSLTITDGDSETFLLIEMRLVLVIAVTQHAQRVKC